MQLPQWVGQDIGGLPHDFTGQIIIKCNKGGVSALDFTTSRTPPAREMVEARRVPGSDINQN
jgi:hypothetical protein